MVFNKIINKLSKIQKIYFIIFLLFITLFLTVTITSLARYKNRVILLNTETWDGSVALKYKKGNGSINNPYVISNGAELAYFGKELTTNDYENNYFILSNDVVLNNGLFVYDEHIKYILNGNTYYVDINTNNYYDNVNYEGEAIGKVNKFNAIHNFKGHFDGNSFSIYGLLMTNDVSEELGLFTNLNGKIENLYVTNSLIKGGYITGGIVSSAYNSLIENVVYDGYVIGNKTNLIKEYSKTNISKTFNVSGTLNDNIELTDDLYINGKILSTKLTGNYSSNDINTSVKINDEIVNNHFELALGTDLLPDISITITSLAYDVVEFTDITYEVVYEYAYTGGIVGLGNNVNLENVVNKGNIIGNYISGGLIGILTNGNIIQSYNTGIITNTNIAGGLIGYIDNSNTSITKNYNKALVSSPISGGVAGFISKSEVLIDQTFNAYDTEFCINKIEETNLTIINSYLISGTSSNEGSSNGFFNLTNINNLKNKQYLITNLGFNEFIDGKDLEINSSNVWVFDDGMPILYIDDLNNSIAVIHASIYSWNNFSDDLSKIKLNSSFAFNVESTNPLKPIKEIYYYINNTNGPLTKNEVANITNWNDYNGIVNLIAEGFYTIYVKVIDYDDNITYLNSDLFILDLSGSDVNINFDDYEFTNLKSGLDYIYINKNTKINITAYDDLSGISKVNYYITDQILTKENLDTLNDELWQEYHDDIELNEMGKYIIYVKVTDNSGFVTYASTDYIVYNGYKVSSFKLGLNGFDDVSNYITNKSSISMDFTYQDNISYSSDYSHNLVSNILLPLGTKITLIDNKNFDIYEYKITTSSDIYNYHNSCDEVLECEKVATYPFSLFTKVGKINDIQYFNENYYDNDNIDENFKVIIDFKNTDFNINYDDVYLYLNLTNLNNSRLTLMDTIKKFNIYSNIEGNDTKPLIYLNTNYNVYNVVNINDDVTIKININSGLIYKTKDSYKIIDTTLEDKMMGLIIKLKDSNGNIVLKEHLKSMIFKIDDKEYYIGEDNVIRINYSDEVLDTSKVIDIITSPDGTLPNGNYYFEITNFISYDGLYSKKLNDEVINIPVKVSDSKTVSDYQFDVFMDDDNRIIKKLDNKVKIGFNIIQNGKFVSPNIRILLYKKDFLTAYNQDYSLVDLGLYVDNQLDLCSENVYYVSTSPIKYNGKITSYNYFELDLLAQKFENNGYKYVFELFDGNKKIGAIEKKFIVR